MVLRACEGVTLALAAGEGDWLQAASCFNDESSGDLFSSETTAVSVGGLLPESKSGTVQSS